MSRILTLGAGYFLHVFIAGFVLGVIRTLWLDPIMGPRVAELFEAPLMLAVIWAASSTRVLRHPKTTPAQWLAVGLTALALLLVTEFTAVLWLRQQTIAQYLAGRDPVGGAVYIVLLLVFAAMPFFWARRAPP